MDNQYRILGVDEGASLSEIKRAFREKAKRLHPDIAGEGARERMQKLLAAYETLSNRERRLDYDRAFRGGTKRGGFNYRDYLYERAADPDSKSRERAQAELIIFELFHFEEDAAVKIWQTLGGTDFPLEKYMEREDWMDCSFVLAEELEKRGFYYEAFRLLVALLREERAKPYFRHFAEDLEIFLKELVRLRLRSAVDDELWVECMGELIDIGFSARDEGRWLKSQAETLANMGETAAAATVFERARKRDPSVTPSAKLKKAVAAIRKGGI
ncbi:MAG: DnaJ domain-containing protein [Spirochaetaceae bacterium]|nr:DnaJ domain-containing protein [Spirochaetaceae bacterium]